MNFQIRRDYPLIVLFALVTSLIITPSIPSAIAIFATCVLLGFREHLDSKKQPDLKAEFENQLNYIKHSNALFEEKVSRELNDLKSDIFKTNLKKGAQNENFRF
jgi:hypothetical protein